LSLTKLARERERETATNCLLYLCFTCTFSNVRCLLITGGHKVKVIFLHMNIVQIKREQNQRQTNRSRINIPRRSSFLCTNFSTIHFALATICSQKSKTRRNEWLRNICTNHRRGFSSKTLKYIYLSIDNPLIDEIFF